MEIREELRGQLELLRTLYCDLHQIPELAFTERETQAYLRRFLETLAPDSLYSVAGTGLKAVFYAPEARDTVAIRADMDALPMAEESGVPLRVRAEVPHFIPVAETDLCVLLSNALENALHACQRQNAAGLPAFIETSAYEQDGRFFLQLANTCSAPVLFEDGVPVTREPGHGLGVRSICAIVEKYGGIYSFTQKQEQFILRISI